MNKIQEEKSDIDKPSNQILTITANEADKLYEQIRKRRSGYAFVSNIYIIVTIIISITISQEGNLAERIPDFLDSVWIVFPYLLAVLIGLEKAFGIEKKKSALDQAKSEIYYARVKAFNRENIERIKNNNQPINNTLASELAEMIANAQIKAIEILRDQNLA